MSKGDKMGKHYGQEDENQEKLPWVMVDRNDIGDIKLGIYNMPSYYFTPDIGVIWFDRSEAFNLAIDILKQLSMYPEDNAARLSRGLDCCCKDYLEE